MLKDDRGLSIVEYIVGGALVLALVGLSVWAVATSVSAQGANVKNAVDDMPGQPSW